MDTYTRIVPYMCIFIDGGWRHVGQALSYCAGVKPTHRSHALKVIQSLWIRPHNNNPVFVGLSVRSCLDLYLQVMNFAAGSEVIVSAINIPDMVVILEHHGLRIVPLDVDIHTLEPKADVLQKLITPRTKLILLAHLYGKMFDMSRYVALAKQHNIQLIEDCAESFCGFDHIGHPESDLCLFSFGTIKTQTAFGGGIAKVKHKQVYRKMCELHKKYPFQRHSDFAFKLIKTSAVLVFIRHAWITKPGMYLLKHIGYDHKPLTVKIMRGFPSDLIQRIRLQPCDALIQLLYHRLIRFDQRVILTSQEKARYVINRLPPCVRVVGEGAMINNYWLFPIIAENPEDLRLKLNELGVDAYRGATQLDMVRPKANEECTAQPDNNQVQEYHLHDRDKDRSKPEVQQKANAISDETKISNQQSRMSLDRLQNEMHECTNPGSMSRETEPVNWGTEGPSLQHDDTAIQSLHDVVETSHAERLENMLHPASVTNPQPSDGETRKQHRDTELQSGERKCQPPAEAREAQYLIDHVVYLPVHKQVPYKELDKICKTVNLAVVTLVSENIRSGLFHVMSKL